MKYQKFENEPLVALDLSKRQLDAWMAWQGLPDLENRVWLARRGMFPIAGGGEVTLRKHYAGLESARGTAVTVTRKVYGTGLMDMTKPPLSPEREDRGTFVKNYRSQSGLKYPVFPFVATMTYDDLPWWCQLALKGGVTGVLQNTTAYKYDFAPTQTSDDLKAATFESGDDTQQYRMPFGMVDSFSIESFAESTPLWKGSFQLIGSDMVDAAYSATPADRVQEDIVTHLSKIAIGAAGAVPSSFITGRFIGHKLSGNNKLSRKFFNDGAAAIMTGVGRDQREYTLEVTWEALAATITERANWTTQSVNRVARVQAQGTNIAGSSAAINRTAEIIVPGRYNGWAIGNRNTHTIFTAMLEAEYDTVLAYDLDVFVINQLVTLP